MTTTRISVKLNIDEHGKVRGESACVGNTTKYDTSRIESQPTPRAGNRTAQCGGRACPQCHKCCDWSYDGDLHDDYKRLRRDSEYRNLVDESRWHRRPDAICTYYFGCSHAYAYSPSDHSYSAFSSSLCECDRVR